MSNQSIIEHKSNMYYVEFREDYLLLCLQCTYRKKAKSKSSPYCKALILAILEHWTNDKRGKGEGLHVFMSYSQWVEEMYGMFGRTTIIDSIEEMLHDGFITRETYKMFGRDTWKYLLNIKLINERMKALPDREPEVTRPQVNGFKSKRVVSTSEQDTSSKVNGTGSKVNSDPFTSNHNIDSNLDSTQTPNTDSQEETIPPDVHTPNILQPAIATAAIAHAPSLSSQYPFLCEYRDGKLQHLYECEKANNTRANSQLSPSRAGELAAAKLAVLIGDELERLYQQVKQADMHGTLTEDVATLYDWIVTSKIDARSDLIALSLSRTILLDMDMYRQQENDTHSHSEQEELHVDMPPISSQPVTMHVTSVQEGEPLAFPDEQVSAPPTTVGGITQEKPARSPRAAKPKEVIPAEEKEIRQRFQAWIDEQRGFKLDERVQIIQERQSVATLAHKIYLYEVLGDTEGYTRDEMAYVRKQLREKDPYWSKPENRDRIGGYAICQKAAEIIARKRRSNAAKEKPAPLSASITITNKPADDDIDYSLARKSANTGQRKMAMAGR